MPLATVDRNLFQPVYLDLFYQMIAERQMVWFKRSCLKQEGPWTEDPILQSEFITNVYRELDPGTIYLLRHILETTEHPADKIFNVIMFRLMGSQNETHEALGFQHYKSYNKDEFTRILKEMEADGKKVFGDSYRVAPYHAKGGGSKIESASIVFEEVAESFEETYAALRGAVNAKALHDVLHGIEGLGDFLTFQVQMDLLYPLEAMNGQPLFPFTHNDWAAPGPGAKNGLKRLIKPGLTPSSYLACMEWLRDNMQSELQRLDLPFVYLENRDGSAKRLHTADMQSCLCEFFKYLRIWNGESKSRVRRFTPSTPVDELDKFNVVIESPSGEVESVGDVLARIDGRTLTPKIPSAAEHERLVGTAVAGGELLQGGGNQVGMPGNAVVGQLPLDYATQLAQAGLVGALGQGVSFNDNQPRLVLVDPFNQFGDDVPYAVLITPIAKSRAGIAVVENPNVVTVSPTDPDHPAAGETEVKS